MFDIGLIELFIVAAIALIVLGPERLPSAARSVGLMIGKFRRTMGDIQEDLERQARLDELKEKLKDPQAIFSDEKKQSPELEYDDEQEADLDMQEAELIKQEDSKGLQPLDVTASKPEKIDKQKITIQSINSNTHD